MWLQGMMIIEQIVDHVAQAVGKTAEEVRELNFYVEGDTTHYGQVLVLHRVPSCWTEVIEQAGGLKERQVAVDDFNAKNRFRKRGISVIPTKFGISFTALMLNQVTKRQHREGTLPPASLAS